MKDTLSKVLIFAVGAAIGSAVTWKIVKTKYERIAQEEIDSVKEMFCHKKEKIDIPERVDEKPVNHDASEYASILEEEKYTDKVEEVETMDGPRVISPDEFMEMDDYENVTLIYYADDVLTDDMNIPIEDVDGMIGRGSLNHFGEYEEDTVFVRDDEAMVDYEICRDSRNYSDVVGD